MSTSNGIHPAVRVGHVHLHVSDLDRALAFYNDALGFNLVADARGAGLPMAFLAAGDYHHHVGLNTFKPSGLYHVAFNYPSCSARSSGSGAAATRSTTRPTMAAASPSTSTIPTATASSSPTTARARPGSTPAAARF
jgi:catechol 2,3-dioxygenase-like lactoylglutathione lyase family enzyme